MLYNYIYIYDIYDKYICEFNSVAKFIMYFYLQMFKFSNINK